MRSRLLLSIPRGVAPALQRPTGGRMSQEMWEPTRVQRALRAWVIVGRLCRYSIIYLPMHGLNCSRRWQHGREHDIYACREGPTTNKQPLPLCLANESVGRTAEVSGSISPHAKQPTGVLSHSVSVSQARHQIELALAQSMSMPSPCPSIDPHYPTPTPCPIPPLPPFLR